MGVASDNMPLGSRLTDRFNPDLLPALHKAVAIISGQRKDTACCLGRIFVVVCDE